MLASTALVGYDAGDAGVGPPSPTHRHPPPPKARLPVTTHPARCTVLPATAASRTNTQRMSKNLEVTRLMKQVYQLSEDGAGVPEPFR